MEADLLHTYGLKRTPIRIAILNLFMNNDFALCASDIIARLKVENDRVTIYRALASFERHGILHKASEDANGVKYALCNQSCPQEKHTDTHAHFICNECNRTYCLEDIIVPEVEISEEFLVASIDYTLKGICKECRSSIEMAP